MTDKYFCYSPDSGFDTFKTLEQAKEAANESLDYYRNNASDGWNDEVENICWGEIRQATKVSDKRPCDNPEFDYTVDYALGELENDN